MSHTLKIWERIIEGRLRKQVTNSNEQFGFILERSTTDAIVASRQILEKYREGHKNLHCVFMERPTIRFHEQSYGIA